MELVFAKNGGFCRGVKKAVDANGAIGILTGALTASAGGITASVVFALLASVLFKSKPKN